MGCIFVCVSGLSYGNWARNVSFLEFMIISEKCLLVLLGPYSPFVSGSIVGKLIWVVY